MSTLKVFAFSPGWGLPTTGPFALKLELWLRLAGLEYERAYENDTRKGPKGKNPWIEIDGVPMGDTALIIARLSRERGIDLDSHLTPRQRATALALTRMVEEHLHQVLEWELFLHDEGFREVSAGAAELPSAVRWVVMRYLRAHFSKQLWARGIARHTPAEIAAMGAADLDALEELIEGPYLFGDTPCTADASIFGLVAPFVFCPAGAPVMKHAKSLPVVSAYCRRIVAEHFGDATAQPQPV